jgi:hypothetical protein
MKSCKQCTSSGTQVGPDMSLSTVCRFEPPKVSAAPINTPQGLAWATMTVWPTVTDNDWCERYVPGLQLNG